jgi:hypothetical protein
MSLFKTQKIKKSGKKRLLRMKKKSQRQVSMLLLVRMNKYIKKATDDNENNKGELAKLLT